MKKHAYIYIGLLALLLTAATVWRLHPAEPEGGELYRRYKDVPGVRVGFVKDFPVSDSTCCDVTVFEALTDEGWEWMLDEFQRRDISAMWDSIAPPSNKSTTLDMWVSAPNHPEVWGSRLADPAADSNDYVFASLHFRWMASFRSGNSQQQYDVVHAYMVRSLRDDLEHAPGSEAIKEQ